MQNQPSGLCSKTFSQEAHQPLGLLSQTRATCTMRKLPTFPVELVIFLWNQSFSLWLKNIFTGSSIAIRIVIPNTCHFYSEKHSHPGYEITLRHSKMLAHTNFYHRSDLSKTIYKSNDSRKGMAKSDKLIQCRLIDKVM